MWIVDRVTAPMDALPVPLPATRGAPLPGVLPALQRAFVVASVAALACRGDAEPARTAPTPAPAVVVPPDAAPTGAPTRLGYAAITDGARRDHNDNFFSIDEDRATFFIADGTRASASDPDPGESAAKIFEHVPAACAPETGRGELLCLLATANTRLYQAVSRAAAVAAIVVGRHLDVEVAGDAKAYLMHDGHLRDLVLPKLVADPLGAGTHTRIDDASADLVPGDRVLLSSVGLPQTLDTAEIEIALTGADPDVEQRLHALEGHAKQHGLQDDLTLILLEVREPHPPAPRSP